jgi:prepilin-type N-terminal cleavage/methylation domain-containing protein
MTHKPLKALPYLSHSDPRQSHSESGLTLLECLVAIVVIAFSAAAVAPAMVLTIATRVQSQKADQALALGQGEIDRIRLIMERGPDNTSELPLSAVGYSATNIRTVPAPSSFVPSGSYTDPIAQARLVDIDGDGDNDFGVQVFRGVGVLPSSGSSTPVAFSMGVRVYDVRAQDNLPLEAEQAAVGLTSGEGQRRKRPLAVLYTNILRGDADSSLCDYANSLSSTGSTGLDCN